MDETDKTENVVVVGRREERRLRNNLTNYSDLDFVLYGLLEMTKITFSDAIF